MSTRSNIELSLAPADIRTFYRSAEVVALTGISPRQLQWWDEKGWLQPRNRIDHSRFASTGHARVYDAEQVETIRWAVILRRDGKMPLRHAIKAAIKIKAMELDPALVSKILLAVNS
jgi:DNA-binding transcriptional MerR regulator